MGAMGSWIGGTPERPATFFDTAEDFRAWLSEHHDSATELWMGLFKKRAAAHGLTYAEALPEALCYGWIDSVVQRLDDVSVRQRWTPRKPTSVWSTTNVATVERLIAEGRMHPSGLAAFAARGTDRQGQYAYEQSEALTLPPEYEALLDAQPGAREFLFERAPASYRKQVIYWVLSAKQQATRDRRMAELVADCAAGRPIKLMRYGELPAWARGAAADRGSGEGL